MEVEVTETKTHLEISEGVGMQIEASEAEQVISPESKTAITIGVQDNAAHIVRATKNQTTVEVIQENISVAG